MSVWNSVTTTRVCPNCGFVFSSTAQPGEPIHKPDVARPRDNSAMLRKLVEHTASYAKHNRALEVAQRDSDRHKVQP